MSIYLIIILILLGLCFIIYLLFLFNIKILKNNNIYISHTLLFLLIIQFILGMINNLYINIPKQKPYLIWHSLNSVSIHSFVALLLIIFSIFFLINSIRNRKYDILARIGIFGILLATLFGVFFVLYGGNNIFSLLMALGFIISFVVYSYISFSTINISS